MKNVSGKIMLRALIAMTMFFAGCGASAFTSPLRDATMKGDTKEMERLIKAGAPLEELIYGFDFSPLYFAVYKGQVEAARLLIEKGAIVDKKAEFWGDDTKHWACICTPLYIAVLNSDVSMVALLLEKGANRAERVIARDGSGTTPLKAAQERGDIAVLEMFKRAEDKKLAKYVPAAVAAPPASTPVANEIASDVDDLPVIKAKPNKNAYAIVIGIESYRQKLPKADFAAHDAKIMTEYLTKVMGYPEENVITLINEHATNVDFAKYFEKWLKNNVEKDGTVFIYYSGHGAPNPKTGDAFLVPYDADPAFIDETGYSIKRLYDALGKLPAKEIVVAMDSCFSGAGGRSVIAKGARPLVMNLDKEIKPLTRNMTVMSASSGDEISSTYDEKGHGLFTYFFLKGLKGEGDANGDGRIDTGELFLYLKPNVQRTARKAYNNEQSPQLFSPADGKDVRLR